MSISLGVLSFGVEADTKKLDKNINDADKKINRFSMIGVQRLNSLNSFNVSKGKKEIDSLNNKLRKTQSESSKTQAKLEQIDQKMRELRSNIAETSGLNLQYDMSQNSNKRMTTTEYDEKLEKLAMEDKEYQKLVDKEQQLYLRSQQHSESIDTIKTKISQVGKETEKAGKIRGFNNTIKTLGSGIKNISSRMGNILKKTLQWSSILFGVGGVISVITRGINSYLESNEQMKANLDYMFYAIGQALAPAIQWVINLFQNLLAIVGAIAQVFFGVNIFANSFANYMKQANKNAKATKKSLGQLAGFDEINNIGANDNTGASGSSVTMPNFNLENKIGEWIPKIEELKNKFEEWKWAILGVVGALALIKIGSLLGLAAPMIAGIVLIFARIRFYNTRYYKYG